MPTVTTVHDIGFIDAPDLYGNRPLARGAMGLLAEVALRVLSLGRYGSSELDYHRWSLELALRCAAVVTVSQFTADRIRHRFRQHPPLVPIQNGLTKRAVSDSERPIPQPYVLYVGRLERKKNIAGMLRVFQRYLENEPNAPEQLVLGGSPGLGFSDIGKLLETEPLRSRVTLTGYLNEAALGAYLAHANAFLFLPHYEGFGMPVVEAMAAGVPVVASDIPALREVAGDAVEFVDPGEPDFAARTLASVLHDTTLRKRMGSAGRSRSQQFQWDEAAKRTLAALLAVGERRKISGALLN
jgi:glycosyltransferase involved in cell wall biosynthesis